MQNEDSPDRSPAGNNLHQEVTAQVIAYLDAKGVGERNRVSLIADITGLSVAQARRRLGPEGPTWTVEELVRVAQHHGDQLADVLVGADIGQGVDASQHCEIEIAGGLYGVQARIGSVATERKPSELVAVPNAHRWRLMPFADVIEGADCHEVTDLRLLPKLTQNIRVAILDDDASVAEALRDALVGGGLSAVAFASDEQLIERFAAFDVFIIDFVLAAGRTASSIIERIRGAKPKAPIIVLTGHAREAASGEIASLVRTFGVDVQEKPAQIMILESLIESRSDGWRQPSA